MEKIEVKTSCKEYVQITKEKIKNSVSCRFGDAPCLCVFQVDNNPASDSYIKGKKKDCEEVGIRFRHVHIDSNECSEEEFCEMIKMYNDNPFIHGIIIQLPIPDKYRLNKLMKYISREKDVDGFKVDSLHNPCTPLGIMNWIEYNGIDLNGKNVCVVGRSEIVGKPLVNMMIEKGATVTCCNSKTKDLVFHTSNADIVVTAIGRPKYFDERFFSDKTKLIIDVGINRDENGKLCGDVDFDNVKKNCNAYVTPVPGSVGLLTRTQLLGNTLDAHLFSFAKTV